MVKKPTAVDEVAAGVLLVVMEKGREPMGNRRRGRRREGECERAGSQLENFLKRNHYFV
jgi:hypothetical protein